MPLSEIHILTKLMAFGSLTIGMIHLLLTMWVLQEFEKAHGRKALPGNLSFWPFYQKIKNVYPSRAAIGRVLLVAGLLLCIPFIIEFIAYRANI